MKVIETGLPGVLILEPRAFGDARGFFLESFNERDFRAATKSDAYFVQDNHSRSTKGVLRGLHYQLPPAAQGKLVRVANGSVFDAVVDLRRASPTFGQYAGIELSAENRRQLWIPPGLAHGFLVLSETVDFLYKTTAYYEPALERAVRWDDPTIGVEWPLGPGETPILSAKDVAAPLFEDAASL